MEFLMDYGAIIAAVISLLGLIPTGIFSWLSYKESRNNNNSIRELEKNKESLKQLSENKIFTEFLELLYRDLQSIRMFINYDINENKDAYEYLSELYNNVLYKYPDTVVFIGDITIMNSFNLLKKHIRKSLDDREFNWGDIFILFLNFLNTIKTQYLFIDSDVNNMIQIYVDTDSYGAISRLEKLKRG